MQKVFKIILIIIAAVFVAICGLLTYIYIVTSVPEGQTICSVDWPTNIWQTRHCGFGLKEVIADCPQIPGASCCYVCEKTISGASQKQEILNKQFPLAGETDQTADWKTYTNTQYGFEFKYPSSAAVNDKDCCQGAFVENIQIYPKNQPNLNTSGIDYMKAVGIQLYEKGQSDIFDTWSESNTKNNKVIKTNNLLAHIYVSDSGYTDIYKTVSSTFKFTNPTAAFNWEGTYEFDETAKALAGYTMGEGYVLSISSADGRWHIGLNVDGFQAELRILATANNVGDSLDVIFDSYDSPQQGGLKKGDVMFTLTPTSSGLAIKWKGMQPNFANTDVNHSVFVKTK